MVFLGTLVTTSGTIVKGITMPAKLNFPIKLRISFGTLAHVGNPSIPEER